mgnify:CR=1 FL=1
MGILSCVGDVAIFLLLECFHTVHMSTSRTCSVRRTDGSLHARVMTPEMTYSGYNKCTFVSYGRRRLPRSRIHPLNKKPTPSQMLVSSNCPSEIYNLHKSETCRTSSRTSIEHVGRLSARFFYAREMTPKDPPEKAHSL